MAKLCFQGLAHSYLKKPGAPSSPDWVIKQTTHTWEDGGAFALLGPSGCGKSTMLNILSGLLAPSCGKVLFDDEDVTHQSPQQRNIAQVFQFPVVYDTMSVRDNLSFPLRNRGFSGQEISVRVNEVAQALELESQLNKPAAGLGADVKQKISMGRGLVRTDVSAILLDEPLTVIDPELKWRLRANLKTLYRRFGHTMIYVTHDQTEALTFADHILVMHDGCIVQQGGPVELFEAPRHKFVGHFIGSPGMNFAQCEIADGAAVLGGIKIPLARKAPAPGRATVEIGVRPEFVKVGRDGLLSATIKRVTDVGRYRIAEVAIDGVTPTFKSLIANGEEIPSHPKVSFVRERTYIYYDGWLADEAT